MIFAKMKIIIKNLSLLLLVCMQLTGIGLLAEEIKERPTVGGIILPIPIKSISIVSENRLLSFADSLVPLMLELNRYGKVRYTVALNPEDSLFARVAMDNFSGEQFYPGMIGNNARRMKFAAVMIVRAGKTKHRLKFGIDADSLIRNYSIFEATLRANNLSSVKLENFPSYFCNYKISDSLPVTHYLLTKVEFDKKGRPLKIEKINSSGSQFEQELSSAINWAKYSPAKKRGIAQKGTSYVLVTLFPEVTYPAKVRTDSTLAESYYFEKYRIQLFGSRPELILPPIPKNLNYNNISIVNYPAPDSGRVSLLVIIDTLGQTNLLSSGRIGHTDRYAVKSVVSRVRFYPAKNFDGLLVSFRGILDLETNGSTYVRILPRWLNQPQFQVAP